jgi:hypothetical protein
MASAWFVTVILSLGACWMAYSVIRARIWRLGFVFTAGALCLIATGVPASLYQFSHDPSLKWPVGLTSGTRTTEKLDERYDPEHWMASGKNLVDFLPTGPGAEQYYAAHPELGQRVKRYWATMSDATIRARRERNEFLVEEDLRALWRSTD